MTIALAVAVVLVVTFVRGPRIVAAWRAARAVDEWKRAKRGAGGEVVRLGSRKEPTK